MAPSERMAAPGLRQPLKAADLAGDWVLDSSRSTVSLRSSVMRLIPVKGVFRRVSAAGTVSPAGEVSGTFTVAAASVDTGNAKRDKHLRSADFFDSDNYPDITFAVSAVRPTSPALTVSGTLSVRDRMLPLKFEGTGTLQGDDEVWLDAAVVINQTDFGLTWNLLGMVSTSNTIAIHAVFSRR